MTLDKRNLEKILEEMWITSITSQQRDEILERFATEPDDENEWTEQDICEQIRSMVRGL